MFKNASSDPGLADTFVQTEAVKPYGESFMSLIASSSDETCRNYWYPEERKKNITLLSVFQLRGRMFRWPWHPCLDKYVLARLCELQLDEETYHGSHWLTPAERYKQYRCCSMIVNGKYWITWMNDTHDCATGKESSEINGVAPAATAFWWVRFWGDTKRQTSVCNLLSDLFGAC